MSYNMPRNFLRPLGRQPIQPGTHRRWGSVNTSNTYIQNNFFGNSGGNFGSYWNSFGGGYGGYGCNGNGGGGNKLMNWFTGIGAASLLGGFMLNMFGFGQKQVQAPLAAKTQFIGSDKTEKKETEDSSDSKLAAARKNFEDTMMLKHGLKAGDVKIVQDENGNISYLYKGKEYKDLSELENALNAKNTKSKGSSPEEEFVDNGGTGDGAVALNDWINNYYKNPGDIPPAAKDNTELIKNMQEKGIMNKNSTPDDIINQFVSKELSKLEYVALTSEQKNMLKAEIIEHNIEVFDQTTGKIKKDADYQNLNIPGVNYVIRRFNMQKDSVIQEQKAKDWNDKNPERQVKIAKNSSGVKYSTTVNISGKSEEITADNFDELQRKVNLFCDKQITPQNVGSKTRIGGVAGLSGSMSTTNK